MAPPTSLDAALPSRRSRTLSPPRARPSASPDAHARGLLATRVLTVAEFRQERRLRALQNPPPPPPRGIPVPLYPEESERQYERTFRQWLAEQNQSLEQLRRDPKRERKLRLTFAFLRETPSRPHKRSINEEYEAFYQRSASMERKRLRRDRASMERHGNRERTPPPRSDPRRTSNSASPRLRDHLFEEEVTAARPTHDDLLSSFQLPPRTPRGRSASPGSHAPAPPAHSRSETEILAQRVLSVEEYVLELKLPKLQRPCRGSKGKLAPIPVPLLPGETPEDYERKFGRWLHQKQTSVLSLRDKPLKERVYRHQFAHQRAMSTSSGTKHSGSHNSSRSPQVTTREDLQKAHEPSWLTHNEDRQRLSERSNVSEALSPSKSPNPSSESAMDHNVNQRTSHHFPSTIDTDNTNQERTEENHSIHNDNQKKAFENTASSQMNPQAASITSSPSASKLTSNEKRLTPPSMFCPQIIEHVDDVTFPANETPPSPALSSEKKATSTGKPSSNISRHESNIPEQEMLPAWAIQLVYRVQELEAKVNELQGNVRCCTSYHSDHGDQRSFSRNVSGTEAAETVSEQFSSTDVEKTARGSDSQRLIITSVPHNTPLTTPSHHSPNQAETALSNEDIHRDATALHERAVQSKAKEDKKKLQLTKAYEYLNEQIMMNETAINDALDYIKAIKDVDEATAIEQHNQIMELVVSINTEKEKRASALAALIRYTWNGKKDDLLSILNEKVNSTCTSAADHERLSVISSQIEQKDNVLGTLASHLNEQLQWVTGIPPCVSEEAIALRFKALQKMSKRLAKELARREQLERDREEILQRFVRGDNDIRKLLVSSSSVNGMAKACLYEK